MGIHGNSKDFRQVLECYYVVRMRKCTDKSDYIINELLKLNFRLVCNMQNPNSENHQKIYLTLLQIYNQKRLFLDIV